MKTTMIKKRGHESALSACPAPAAASHLKRERLSAGAVFTFQGTGLPVRGTGSRTSGVDTPVAYLAVRIQQLVPTHPGETARRPPA